MITYLDLLIIVSMVLMAASLMSLLLMFLIKNKIVRKVCFYIVVTLSLFVGYAGIRINWPFFFGQAALAVLMIAVSLGALVLSLVKRNNDKVFLAARIAAAAALLIGVVNALLI